MDFNINSLILLVICVITSLFTVVIILNQINKNRAFRQENNNIKLDKYREYYEERLYKLQNDLVENQRRWEDVNNLIISGQQSNLIDNKNTQQLPESFLKRFGINLSDLEYNDKSVFVLTPFLEREFDTYNTIKEVCTEVNLNCSRGDETYRDKDLLMHIITSIAESSIIIANINGRNPNVFYELGICHSIGKPVILVSNNKKDLPFDIQNKNIIFYNNKMDLNSKLKSELLRIFIDKA